MYFEYRINLVLFGLSIGNPICLNNSIEILRVSEEILRYLNIVCPFDLRLNKFT